MTQEEINALKDFIIYYNNMNIYKYCNIIDEKSIFNGNDKEISKNVLNLIMKYQTGVIDYFSFTNFLKPLIKKLAIKLFNYGEITAEECLYYKNISLI